MRIPTASLGLPLILSLVSLYTADSKTVAAAEPRPASRPAVRDADRVLVIRNENSPVSKAVADDYARRRAVRNVLSVRCQDSAAARAVRPSPFAAYEPAIEKPVRASGRHVNIDFIVLTKGIPIRIADAPGRGVDGRRPAGQLPGGVGLRQVARRRQCPSSRRRIYGTAWANRFWNSSTPFAHAKFGGYLVTRLDGYTEADAKALTTRALAAEQPAGKAAGKAAEGKVLLDTCPAFGYADRKAQPRPVTSDSGEMDTTSTTPTCNARPRPPRTERAGRSGPGGRFAGKRNGLLAYVSWGSNDRHYDAAAYRSLRFAPGAVCETAVSTSARTFLPTQGGQSLIADLIGKAPPGRRATRTSRSCKPSPRPAFSLTATPGVGRWRRVFTQPRDSWAGRTSSLATRSAALGGLGRSNNIMPIFPFL